MSDSTNCQNHTTTWLVGERRLYSVFFFLQTGEEGKNSSAGVASGSEQSAMAGMTHRNIIQNKRKHAQNHEWQHQQGKQRQGESADLSPVVDLDVLDAAHEVLQLQVVEHAQRRQRAHHLTQNKGVQTHSGMAPAHPRLTHLHAGGDSRQRCVPAQSPCAARRSAP